MQRHGGLSWARMRQEWKEWSAVAWLIELTLGTLFLGLLTTIHKVWFQIPVLAWVFFMMAVFFATTAAIIDRRHAGEWKDASEKRRSLRADRDRLVQRLRATRDLLDHVPRPENPLQVAMWAVAAKKVEDEALGHASVSRLPIEVRTRFISPSAISTRTNPLSPGDTPSSKAADRFDSLASLEVGLSEAILVIDELIDESDPRKLRRPTHRA